MNDVEGSISTKYDQKGCQGEYNVQLRVDEKYRWSLRNTY